MLKCIQIITIFNIMLQMGSRQNNRVAKYAQTLLPDSIRSWQ